MLKKIAYLFIGIGVIGLLAGAYSRFTVMPLYIVPGGLEAEAMVLGSNTCFVIAILLIMLEKKS